ncbi:protein HUA2-LIKE 2 [Sesamum angolense]|uniref:Protein HUA2-LIKE 2 n=1 Tax=Sesamum angolense TaxID=2727404 RepID=A0AAE2C3T4_9LAMI|nr:protein HUA2-LIKE 2 [Sesamum angolense]
MFPNTGSVNIKVRIPDQVKHLRQIVEISDVRCVDNLRMKKQYLFDNGYANGEGFFTPYHSVRYHLKEWDRGGGGPQNAHELFSLRPVVAQNVIERSFGLLKTRWGILQTPSYYFINVQNCIVIACCLLHNYMNPVDEEGTSNPRRFRVGYLNQLETLMFKQFPNADLRAEPHNNSKIHVWKKYYSTLVGGMGIQLILARNKALICKHLWGILLCRASLFRGPLVTVLDANSKVSDVIHQGEWAWPHIGVVKILEIKQQLPNIQGHSDVKSSCMAPSRRKGANKAKAAAGRPKWKVGDLVLAKVKGFPAWPATSSDEHCIRVWRKGIGNDQLSNHFAYIMVLTFENEVQGRSQISKIGTAQLSGFRSCVSEPQKWGYPADLKKVLVYFFGTQQIAFCNPADVEEFTEEKKVSLLGKRHGKGSDFVRALNEIIDCFEKQKKQDQITSDDITEETNVTNENNSDESLTKSVTDEAPVITAKEFSGGAANDLNSLTEAAVAAAAKDALHDEEMQLEEANSNSVFADARVYSTRSKTDAAQSRNIVGQRRISGRKLRSSSRINASRLQRLMLPSTNNTRSSRRLGDNALQDRSVRRSKRIMKSSDDSEGHDVDSPAFVSHDSVEENDSEIMTVDSDTLSSNDGSSVDSGCEPVGEGPSIENNEGETELSDRLDFQTNATIIKKKRKPNRKRHRNDIVLVAKLDEVISEAEELKTECISPSNNEKVPEKYAKEDGDEHLPLVKRARVRMGRPSPPGDEEAHEVEQMMEVPGNLAVQSSGHLNSKLDSPADRETLPIKEDQGTSSSLLHAGPARKPKYWETRKSFVDGEAALPPSKRLHRALEAMSANVAEDNQRDSICSPTVDTHTNGFCSSSFAECSEQSMERKDVVELGSGQVEDHKNGDSHSSASGFCARSNMEVPENDGKTNAGESDCGKSCLSNSSNPEFGKDSFEHVEGADSKSLKLLPLDECPEKADAEHQHINPDSPNCGEKLSHLDSNEPCLILEADGCKIEPAGLNEAAKRSEPDVSQTNSDSIMVEEIAGSSLNIDKDTLIDNADGRGDKDTMTDSADGGGDEDTLVDSADGGSDEDILIDSADGGADETHKTKHLYLSETNQNGPRTEFVEAAGPESPDSNVMPSATL